MRALLACLLSLAGALSASAKAGEWSAPYLGLFLGYGDANDAWDQGVAPGDPRISPEGLVFGGFAGYQHDFAGIVLGAEADLSFPDLSDAAECSSGVDCAVDVQVLSSLRGRAGLALGSLQIYGAAGLALAFIQAESDTLGASDSKALTGWTLGAGAEYQAPQGLRFGLEYRHSDYGDADVALGAANGDVRLEVDEIRARISFAFD